MGDSKPADHPIIRARWIILLVFAAICGWLIPGVADIENDDDVLAFLPPDHPDIVAFHEVADRFGILEVALVGLRSESGDVLAPERGDEIRALSKRVSEIEGVNFTLSMADLPNPEVTEDGMVVAALVPPELRDPQQIRERVLSNRNAVGNVVSADGEATALMVFLLPKDGGGADAFGKRRDTLNAIRDAVSEAWTGEVHFGGAPFVEMAASDASRTDIEDLSPIVIVVLALASALLLRSITAAVLNLILAGVGVGLIMGAHGRFDEALTIVSSSTPVMMVALGGAFGVHILAGYQRQHGTSRERATGVLRELWLPVLLSGCTTSVAFFALVAMPQVPMQRFGIAAGMGMLLLLVLALLVLPALLAVLPNGLLKPRDEARFWLPPRPPTLLVAALAGAGVLVGLRMEADPDTSNVFEEATPPKQADAFFQEHFGGSTFLMVTVHGSVGDDLALLQENEVLRRIRDIGERVSHIDGVVDVRSIVEPIEVVNEAMGGRRGVPENTARSRRGMTYLLGHPAMAQLMTDDGNGAVIHIKLAPMSGAKQVEITEEVREILAELGQDGLRVAATSEPDVASRRKADVQARLDRLLERDGFEKVSLDELGGGGGASPEVVAEITKLRDNLFDEESDENIFETSKLEVSREEIEALVPADVLEPRGEALESLMKAKWPTVAEKDPEGIKFAAEHLGSWVDDLIKKYGAGDRCAELKLGEDACALVKSALSELDDEEWVVPADSGVDGVRDIDIKIRLTGQPVIGQAFAESVTTSLATSTLVSLAALSLVLVVARFVPALIPAIWTLAVTAGVIALLGHPISVGTSMVSCIALGAGVDFAIHLSFRAREYKDDEDAGEKAVRDLGPVVLISAVQLGLAFLVLNASQMRPLQDFGTGLAVGLFGAALGAVWLTPLLNRGRRTKAKKSKS